jgi:hypothetical protein
MLHQLDEALVRMLRAGLEIDRADLDIVFETPDGEWGARVTKPTVNVFLWDIRRSAEESRSGRERVFRDGQDHWRPSLPRMEFQYLLTAWTTEVADEHDLLGRCLVAILRYPTLEGDLAPSFAKEGAPPATVRVARTDGKDLADFWGAIDGKLKPGLNLVVSTSIDPRISIEAGPPTESYRVEVSDRRDPKSSARRRFAGRSGAVGAVVRSPRGVAVVDEHGRFFIDAEPGDEIVVETDPPETVIAGATSGTGS